MPTGNQYRSSTLFHYLAKIFECHYLSRLLGVGELLSGMQKNAITDHLLLFAM